MIPISLPQPHPEDDARFGAARDGVCVLGPDWKIRYANASLLEILRLLGGGSGVATLWDALPGWEQTPQAALLREAMAARQPLRFQLDAQSSGGRVWEVDAEPLASGELRLRLRNATAQAARAVVGRQAAALAQLSVGLLMLEPEGGRLLEANPAALALLGLSPDRVGQPLEFPATVRRRLERVAASGVPWRAQALPRQGRWLRVEVQPLQGSLLATLVEVTREVAARRAACAALRSARRLLDALPVAVAVAAPGGAAPYLNPAARRVAGPGDLAGPLLARALGGERVDEEELSLTLPDGAQRVVVASASPVEGEDGQVRRAVSVLRDVTDRRHMERALVASRAEAEAAAAEAALRAEESRALREIGRALVSEPEPDRVLHLAAHAAAELLAARGAFVATPVAPRRILFSPATGALAPLHGRLIPLAGSTFEGLEDRNGTRIFNSLEGIPLRGTLRARLQRMGVDRLAFAPMHAFGERLGTLGVVDREGTFTAEDARVLESLADSAALALHNARLLGAAQRRAEEGEALLGAAAAVISTLDAEEVMQRIVAIAERLTGADGASITLVDGEAHARLRVPVATGVTRGWLGAGGPLSGSITERVLRQDVALTLSPADLAEGHPARSALEALEAASYTLAPMRAGGEAMGVLGVVHQRGHAGPRPRELPLLQSLADQAALAIRNARLYQQAQAAGRAKSQFLATMSHELRTPINALEGYASLLQDGVFGPVNAEQAHALGRMRASQSHLLALIEQVLDAARLEAGARRPQAVDLDGAEVAAAVVEALRGVAERKGLSLALDAPAPVRLRTDAGLLRQILTNVVGNALKFTERGGVTVTVRATGTGVRIAVQDTGPGIAAEHLEHIWQPFYQAEPAMTRREGGTGLGLALSRDYARLLGGDMSVRSELGSGCTFELLLPSLAVPA